MSAVPWADRLVEVIADLGPAGYRYGSGCIVAGKTVLTAAHVVAGAVGLQIRDVRKRLYPAVADAGFVGDPDGPGPDLALLRADGLPGDGLAPLPLARAVRDAPLTAVIEDCHAFGYPGFAESPAPGPSRDTVQAAGFIAPLSKLARGLLGMVVSIEPAALGDAGPRPGESPWAGMSGGPVTAAGHLIGVIAEHALAEGSSALTVVPLTALEADPARPGWGPGVPDPAAWWQRLGAEGPHALRPVPQPEPTAERRPAYLAQVERIAPAELLGRAAELAALAEFCTAPGLEPPGTGPRRPAPGSALPGSGPYRWLRAPAWVGKSALLSWFALHPPPGIRVVSFFVTARYAGQDDRVAFADAVLEQLLALLGQPAPALLTESTRDAHLLAKLGEAAALCRARGERLVLVVDGLDEDRGTGGHSIAALLPARPVAGLRVVVAGRLNPPLPADIDADHPLHDPAAVRPLAQSSYAALTRSTTRREIKRLLADPDDRQLLGFVTAAGGGLTTRDLAELSMRQEWEVEDRLHATAGRTFGTRAGIWQQREAYVLGHEELQNDALALFGPQELEHYRRSLHDWADTYRGRGWPEDTPDFLLQGYVRLLRAAGSPDRMAALVTEPARHARLLERTGAESAAMAELAAAQEAVLAAESVDLTALATIAVHRDVMARRSRNISAELPALWAELGEYSRAQALAMSITDPVKRAEALEAVAAAATPERGGAHRDPETGAVGPPAAASPGLFPEPDPDHAVKSEVGKLIDTARDHGGATTELLDAAEAIAYTARDPELRADLWNELATARSAIRTNRTPGEWPGRELVPAGPEFPHGFDSAVRRLLSTGRLDHAETVVRAAHRTDRNSPLPSVFVDHVTEAGDPDRAERFARSLPEGRGKEDVLSALIDAAVRGGDLDRAERVARILSAASREPRALVRIARAAWADADADRARALLSQAMDFRVPYLRQWETQSATEDGLRLMVEMGDLQEAIAITDALAAPDLRVKGLLAVAQALHARGDEKPARALAARALGGAMTSAKPWDSFLPSQAAGLMARLGGMDEALAAATAAPHPDTRSRMLDRIREAALDAGDFAAAEAVGELITDPRVQGVQEESLVRARLRTQGPAAALAAAGRVRDSRLRARLVTEIVRHSLAGGDVEGAAALLDAVPEQDLQTELRIMVTRVAVASAAPARAREMLAATEAAVRSLPDPAWRAGALTEAAWAVLPYADSRRTGALTAAAEAAARRIPEAAPRAAALVGVAAAVAVAGDPARADGVFEEAARACAIPCAWAERLADRARATAARGQKDTARAQLSALGRLTRRIAEPHNQVRAAQARLAAAIELGCLDQAEGAAAGIGHPDQGALALVDLARALAAAGHTARATETALRITVADRQADALSEVARLAAARGETGPAEAAARAVTVRGGRSSALLGVAWETARSGDLARAERIVASIPEPEWRELGQNTLRAQHGAPADGGTRSGAVPAPPGARTRPGAAPGVRTRSAEAGSEAGSGVGVGAAGPAGLGRAPVGGTATDTRTADAEADPRTADADTAGAVRRADALLARADRLLGRDGSGPEPESAGGLVAEAIRIGPCSRALPTLGRLAPAAALAAADALLALLGQEPTGSSAAGNR